MWSIVAYYKELGFHFKENLKPSKSFKWQVMESKNHSENRLEMKSDVQLNAGKLVIAIKAVASSCHLYI